MTYDVLLGSLVAKYRGKWMTENYTSTISASTTALLRFTILRPWVFYMTSLHGYVSEVNVKLTLYGTDNNILATWTRFMDSNTTLPIIPLLHDTRLVGKRMIGPVGSQYEGTFLFYFQNSSAHETDFNIGVNGFIIPEQNAEAFEEEYKKLYLRGTE